MRSAVSAAGLPTLEDLDAFAQKVIDATPHAALPLEDLVEHVVVVPVVDERVGAGWEVLIYKALIVLLAALVKLLELACV